MSKKLKFQATLTSVCRGKREVFYSNELYIDYNETKKRNIIEHEIEAKKECEKLKRKRIQLPCEALLLFFILK